MLMVTYNVIMMLLIANKIPLDEIDNDTSFHFCN